LAINSGFFKEIGETCHFEREIIQYFGKNSLFLSRSYKSATIGD